MLNSTEFEKLKAISLKNRLRNRKIFEAIFSKLGIFAIAFAVLMLCYLLFSVFSKGYTAFYHYYVDVNLEFEYGKGSSSSYINTVIAKSINESLSVGDDSVNISNINKIISRSETSSLQAFARGLTEDSNSVLRKKVLLTSDAEMYLKGMTGNSSLNEEVKNAIDTLYKNKIIKKEFNLLFFTNADSRYAEIAGIKGALVGSIYTIVLTTIFSVIIGIGTAVYLLEFAPKNTFISFLELNINNLASIPSIIFGLLGLAIFNQFFGIPRSTPMLASLVLTLMALPTIVITTKIALSSVPYSIKEAAYGLGSSKVQVIVNHLLPISLPGILTGVIIAISRVLGETAPLIMIGMVAFVNTVPSKITDTAVVFPAQILLWTNSPELGFIEKASAAIMILLLFLIVVNGISIYLRNKFEVKF